MISFRSTNGDMTWEFVITNPAARDLFVEYLLVLIFVAVLGVANYAYVWWKQ